MGRRGPAPRPYKTVTATVRLHRNVDALLNQLAEAEGVTRSAFVTALLAETAGVPLESLLVPDNETEDEEVLRSA